MNAQPGLDSPRYRALLQVLGTADTILEASRLFFAHWNLTPSQFNVLNLLHLNPDGLSQTDLSHLLIVHRSNVTGLIDRLEKRQLVERREVAADRRAYRVVLAPAGKELLSQVLPGYYAGAEEIWARIPERRIRELTTDLQKAAETAREIGVRFNP